MNFLVQIALHSATVSFVLLALRCMATVWLSVKAVFQSGYVSLIV